MIPRKKPLKRGGQPKRVNPKRKATNWRNAYGSRERCVFVQSLPCLVPFCGNTPSENAHIESGGMGRKAHYTKVVPLCSSHHQYAHQHGITTFLAHFFIIGTLADHAAKTERLWLHHLDHLIQTTP
jgi:hypothetical protein